jgi:hypothetical protein
MEGKKETPGEREKKNKRIAEFTTAKSHLAGKTLPQINSRTQDLRLIADEAWRALLDANSIQEFVFLHAGRPSRIELTKDETGETDETVTICGLQPAMLKHELARVATWYKLERREGGIKGNPANPRMISCWICWRQRTHRFHISSVSREYPYSLLTELWNWNPAITRDRRLIIGPAAA